MKPICRLRRHRGALFVGIFALALSSLIQADTVPNRIDYQGRVVDGNGAPLAAAQPGNYEMEFRVYDADTGGVVVWAEKQLVTVNNGQFSVRLGEGQAILNTGNDIGSVPQAQLQNAFNGSSRHLGITVNIPGQTPGEITPRLSFLSSPFALKAGSASTLDQEAGTRSNLIVGSLAYSTFILNTDAAVDGSASNILVDASTGPLATPLPLNGANKELVFTKNDSSPSAVTVNPPGEGGTINGGSSPILLNKQGDSVTLRNVGGNAWMVVSRYNVNAVNADASGNVQLPGKLTVVGGVFARSGTPGALGVNNNGYAFTGENDSGLFSTADGVVQLFTQSVERMRVNDTGAVGIATATPAATMHILRTAHTGAAADLETLRLEMPGSAFQTQFYRGPNGDHYIRSGNSSGTVHLQDVGGGSVIVGGNGLRRAKLTVYGSKSEDVGNYAYYAKDGSDHSFVGPTNTTIGGAQLLSIYAEERISAKEFNAFSDARIKTVVGHSDGQADLAVLNGIQITDYTFRDTRKNGTAVQKKVIAQQVEKVFPQAVTQTTDVVPDIMKNAEIKDGWITLATDLKKGENVRLLAGKDQDKICEVLEVKKGSFRVALDTQETDVFVYGREVSDFRSVDYDAIAMLNVSATQQVKKDSDGAEAALRAENAALKAKLAAQEKRLATLEQEQDATTSRLAALETALLKGEKNVATAKPESATATKARLAKF